jgi:hypothetical protein
MATPIDTPTTEAHFDYDLHRERLNDYTNPFTGNNNGAGDPSFLSLNSPTLGPKTPIAIRPLPPPPQPITTSRSDSTSEYPEMTSLKPPPRRNSRIVHPADIPQQSHSQEKEKERSEKRDSQPVQAEMAASFVNLHDPVPSPTAETRSLGEVGETAKSLSHHGSVISLGVVSI